MPLMLSVGSLSSINPALLMLFATVSEPPGTMSRVAPAPITRLAAASGESIVTVTGVRISAVSCTPGTFPTFQSGFVSKVPPESTFHMKTFVGGGNAKTPETTVVVTGPPAVLLGGVSCTAPSPKAPSTRTCGRLNCCSVGLPWAKVEFGCALAFCHCRMNASCCPRE